MKNTFKTWSKSNTTVIKNICPDLGMRDWNDLHPNEKDKIWKYFRNKGWFTNSAKIYNSVDTLNERYKRKSYGEKLLEHGGPHISQEGYYPYHKYFETCCLGRALEDFQSIILLQNQDVVYEILSIYAMLSINYFALEKVENEDDPKEKRKLKEIAFEEFDKLKSDFNDLFEQFKLNVLLTRQGIVFRQDSKITNEIYQPVLTYLFDKKWKDVNRDISDAFNEFQKKSPQGYSACITHTISSLQAFLQILVYGKTGKGEINDLIPNAQKKKLIPSDLFTEKIFKNIESILMSERQKSGNPHPKKEYANEKNAKLILNLTMIFIQHCILEE